LPAGNGIFEKDLERAFSFLDLAGHRVIRHLRAGDGCHRMIGGDFHLPLAQRGLADVEFKIRGNPAVGFREFIHRDFGEADFRQHLRRVHHVAVFRCGKPIDKDLAELLIHAAGELSGRELDQSLRVGHLDPNSAVVRHAQPAAVPQRAGRNHAQRLRLHRESAERRLRLDDDAVRTFDRAAEFHLKAAFAAGILDVPTEHRIAFHREHLARAVECEIKARELSLEHAQIQHGHLPQQAAADADVGGFRAGEKQGAILHLVLRTPCHRSVAAGGKETAPLVIVPLRHHRERIVECHNTAQALDFHRNHDTSRQGERHAPPIALAGDGNHE